jgi:hypothetical protein
LANKINDDCKYTGNLTDEWGDKYTPPGDNIMSYHHEAGCREHFTRGQIAIMLYTAFSKQEENWSVSLNPACQFDTHEYNNSFETATIIKKRENQTHTLHLTPTGGANDIIDTDYFRTSQPVKKRLNLELTVEPGQEDFIEVTIYNQSKKTIPARGKKEKGRILYSVNLDKPQFLFYEVSGTREIGESAIYYEIRY